MHFHSQTVGDANCYTELPIWSSQMWLTFCQPLNEMGWRWKQVQCHLLPVDHEISYGETGTPNELSLTACQPCDDLEKISNNVTYSLLTMRQAPWQRAECHSHPVELWKDHDDMPNSTAPTTHRLFVCDWTASEDEWQCHCLPSGTRIDQTIWKKYIVLLTSYYLG